MINLEDFDLVGIAEAIRNKQFSAVELTHESIRRLKHTGLSLNAVFAIDEENALKRASSLDQRQARKETLGLLHGIPLAHKDLIAVKDRRMHAGSKILENTIATQSALVNDYLDQAGQVNVASLHMAEFALSPTGFNQHYGHGKNPWNPSYVSGGSSSGSGIAVGARCVFGSVGSDTGGSIRHPSAMCGITGLKPTNQLLSLEGVFPLSTSLDCVGPMAQSARDCARLLTILTNSAMDYEANLSSVVKGMKIGIPSNYFYDTIDPAIEACLVETFAIFKSLQVEFIEVEVPSMSSINQYMGAVLAYEALQLHEPWLREFPSAYADQVKARIEFGKGISASDYEQALQQRNVLQKEFANAWFTQCDAVLVPTLQIQTPSIESTILGSTHEILANLSKVTQTTKGINYLAFPALSFPVGFTEENLPVGMQLIGNALSEEKLLQLAHAYQGSTNWHRTIPKVVP